MFKHWDGGLFSTFLNVLLVGAPLRIFGFQSGSWVSFCVLNILIFCILFYISRKKLLLSKSLATFISLASVVVWGTFWRLSSLLAIVPFNDPNNALRQNSASFLHWQTAITQYGSTPIICMIILYFSKKSRVRSVLINCMISIFAGILIGTSGFVLASTIFTYIIIKTLNLKIRSLYDYIFVLAIGTGELISYFSPGSQARSSVLHANYNFHYNFKYFLSYLFSSLFGAGMLFMILVGVLSAILVKNSCATANITEFNMKSIKIISEFLPILILFTFMGMIKAGWSPWRFIYVEVLFAVLIFFIFFDFFLKVEINRWLGQACLCLFLTLSFLALRDIGLSVNARQHAWNSGSAPTEGIQDRETDWVKNCSLNNIYQGG